MNKLSEDLRPSIEYWSADESYTKLNSLLNTNLEVPTDPLELSELTEQIKKALFMTSHSLPVRRQIALVRAKEVQIFEEYESQLKRLSNYLAFTQGKKD